MTMINLVLMAKLQQWIKNENIILIDVHTNNIMCKYDGV